MIERAQKDDILAIYAIYTDYVLNSSALFDLHPMDFSLFSKKMENLMEKEPFYVAKHEGKCIGYGYTHPAFEKEAYWACKELTIYMVEGKHYGLAGALLEQIEADLKKQKVRWLISCITASNERSILFHQKHRFTFLGELPDCGEKFNTWHSVVWYGKRLDE